MLRKCIHLAAAATLLWVWSGCGDQTVKTGENEAYTLPDSTKSALLNVSGQLFSIPSPLQTAELIQRSGARYNKSLLHNPQQAGTYQSSDLRALNAGIYGTDMAWASLFDDAQSAIQAFKALEQLANELGVKAAIQQDLIASLAANMGHTDSLLFLSGRFYAAADGYLKENERYDVAALILTGGWIESAWLTSLEAVNGNERARTRLAEQKPTVSTLREVLQKTTGPAFAKSEIMKGMVELESMYRQVEHYYNYLPAEHMPDQKTTLIRSKTGYTISSDVVHELSEKLASLRNLVTQP